MWWKARNSTKHVCIYLTPSTIIWCVIEKEGIDGSPRFILREFKKQVIDNLALEKLVVCNPTYLQQILATPTHDNPVYMLLQGPAMQEKIVTHHAPNLTKEHVPDTLSSQWQWHLAYLYTFDHAYYYYLCGLKQVIILQYQLLAIAMHWHLQSIRPYKIGLLNTYKHLFGSAYREAQLAQDMQFNRNIIPYLFSADDVHRILITSGHSITQEDYIPLLACCGTLL